MLWSPRGRSICFTSQLEGNGGSLLDSNGFLG